MAARRRLPRPGFAVAVAVALALHLGVWAALARPPAMHPAPPGAAVLALRLIAPPAVAPQPAWPTRMAAARPARGVGRAAEPRTAPAAPQARAAPAYLPAGLLDRPALPKSEPDLSLLEGLSFSGLPIRLRVFIEASGAVSATQVLGASPDDAEAVQRLRQVFLATAFVAGLRQGREVASFKDIELRLAPGPGPGR